MHKLWLFIVNHRHWFLLLILEIFSLALFMNDGLYRRGLLFYAQSQIVGHLNETMTEAQSYMNLRSKNAYLLSEKARLEHELTALRRMVTDAQAEGKLMQIEQDSITFGQYLTARIVNQTANLGDLYYMINQGRANGVLPDMAVISELGVVGTIVEASEHYALVIPITNSKLKLSCAVRGKAYQGQLISQGRGASSVLGGLPLHADIAVGDTVVTSGYSYIFPEGLMVGVVEEGKAEGISGVDATFGTYRVRLATDFERLSYVYIRLTPVSRELRELEQSIPLSETN